MENKITDEEIIKALECCTIKEMDCKNCPNKNQGTGCIYETMKPALDLINRQKASNKKLVNQLMSLKFELQNQEESLDIISEQNETIEQLKNDLARMGTHSLILIQNARLEAYKELAEELKRHCSDLTISDANEQLSVCILWEAEEVIDGVLKDMMEGNR